MTEPAWIPPMRSGSSLGPLKALISANLNPQRVSLVAQPVKNPPAMRETWVRSLGWNIPWGRKRVPVPVFWPGEFHGLQSMGSQNRTRLSDFHSNPQRLLSTSLPLSSTTSSFEAPSLLFKNQCLRSSFTKNIPSCFSVPQLLAEAAEFREVTWAHEVQGFCGSGAHRCTQMHTHSHPAGHPRRSYPYRMG